MSSACYCAVIGDIRHSRRLQERAKVQVRFLKAISTVNREFKREIVSRFAISLGDEFQGLLASPAESYRFVRRFQELMFPTTFYFGIGVGRLSTALHHSSVAMDGEVFHRARAAMVEAKRVRRDVLYSMDIPELPLVNALVGLIDHERSRMTPRQKQIAALLSALHTQESVAKRLRISQPVVSRSVAPFRRMHEAETVVQEVLRRFDGVS